MDKKYKKIWELALPYLQKGSLKDFVDHTEGVLKAISMLLKKEKGDRSILIPAAILHDVGWSKVPKYLQRKSAWSDGRLKRKSILLSLEFAPKIIEEVLEKLQFEKKYIRQIIDIVMSHHFKNPLLHEKRMLIDADNLSDAFREQFWGNVKNYNVRPEKLYEFRRSNRFYTKTAQKIFDRELEKRRKEIETGSNI